MNVTLVGFDARMLSSFLNATHPHQEFEKQLKKRKGMKTNYQITIGYKAVITVDVKADNQKEAEQAAIELFKKNKDKMFKSESILLQDDTYGAYGLIDMDKTWNSL
jgi:hypothetical protein